MHTIELVHSPGQRIGHGSRDPLDPFNAFGWVEAHRGRGCAPCLRAVGREDAVILEGGHRQRP